jgi:hypothetical protein
MKKVSFPAFMLVAFLLGCSADGIYEAGSNPVETVEWAKASKALCLLPSGDCTETTKNDCGVLGGVFGVSAASCPTPTVYCVTPGICTISDAASVGTCTASGGNISTTCPPGYLVF